MLFKINTRADVSVIPETVFKQLPGVSLNPPNRCLVGPGQNQLKVSGQFTGKLTYQDLVADEQIYCCQVAPEITFGMTWHTSTRSHCTRSYSA